MRAIGALALSFALFVAWLFAVWPPPIWFRNHWPRETAFMRMRGRVTAYEPVAFNAMAPAVAQAAIAGEDQSFAAHGGIDWTQMRRALGYRRAGFAWGSAEDVGAVGGALAGAWGRRDALRGASTITQQLAKNLYLSPSRDPLRKLKEAVTAYRLESALDKGRILALYLNVAELGDGIWGVEAASRLYYHLPAARLSAGQAAALAGALPFPLSSNPGYRPRRMQARQALILRRMRGERIEIPIPEAEPDTTAAESAAAPADSAAPDEPPPAPAAP